MKYVKKQAQIFSMLLLIALAAGLNSCNIDEPAPKGTPKTFDDYKTQLTKFISSEKLFVDSCKVGYNVNEFTPVSTTSFATYKANYLNDLLKADTLVMKADSVADLVRADASLSTNGKAFRGKINISDRRPLNNLIDSCMTLNNNTPVGTGGTVGVNNVLQEDKAKFLTAIGAANATRDATITIDRQVKEATALLFKARQAFIASFLPGDLPTYISNSSAFIAAQLAIVNNCSVGYGINQYLLSLKTNYLKVLNTAQTTVVTGATWAQVSTAMTSLSSPRTAFIPNVADKKMLNDSIVAADSLLNTTLSVGTANGQISTSVQTNFKTALTSAISIRENANSTDAQVKAGTYALISYKNSVIASIPLHYAINTATALNTATLVGITTGKVSQPAKTAFTTAISAAISIRDTKTTTAAQMIDAGVQLEKARALFVLYIIK